MATIVADGGPVPLPILPTARRFEAAGFRAWPAGATHYDGAWLVRLTEDHPAKRLNSVNPLDPGDVRDIAARVDHAAGRFAAYGRPLTFRLSPLAAPELDRHFDREGWSRFGDSLVMTRDLDDAFVQGAMDQIPLRDLDRFIAASLATHGGDASLGGGLSGVVGAIRAETGLFVLEEDEMPVASAICVHDGDLAGLFEVATAGAARGRGFGRRLVLSALKWARLRGARRAWLQVVADNEAALAFYRSLGFREIYRYHYRRPPV